MASKSGGDLILKAVQDVAELREEQKAFAERMVELTEEYGERLRDLTELHGKQMRSLVQGHAKRADEKLSGMSAAFSVLAQTVTRVDKALLEHDERLRKLEDLAANG